MEGTHLGSEDRKTRGQLDPACGCQLICAFVSGNGCDPEYWYSFVLWSGAYGQKALKFGAFGMHAAPYKKETKGAAQKPGGLWYPQHGPQKTFFR